jgi:flagella basal body P-ring formation protein FlgA
MTRAAAVFTLVVAVLAAGAVLAQSVQPVRALRSKTVLAAEDLVLVEPSVPGAVGSIAAAVGREARVALYPGRPILLAHLGAPALVERNGLVRLSYVRGPLRILTEGRSLDRAAAGDLVRVMNLASRQTVTGTVRADGSVEVAR